MKEETGLNLKNLEQFHTYSKMGRDPRGHTVTIVFTAKGIGAPHAGDDAGALRIFTEKTLPKDLAFDHKEILKQYFNLKREKKNGKRK
jgi:8-oxo-dGTP diphosphatase